MFGNNEGSFLKTIARQALSGLQPDTAAEAKHNMGQNPKLYSSQSGHRLTPWSTLLKSLLPEH